MPIAVLLPIINGIISIVKIVMDLNKPKADATEMDLATNEALAKCHGSLCEAHDHLKQVSE